MGDGHAVGRIGAHVDIVADDRRWLGVVPLVATSDGPLAYEFDASPDGRAVTVHSPTGTGDNLRMVWTAPDTPVSRDHQACDTWGTTDGPITQQGVALRIAATGESVTRAICVMKNIWGGGSWIFNAIGFTDGSFAILGSADLAEAFDPDGAIPSLPWRMCARARGRSLAWKVWPTAGTEPAWGDPMFGATITLPAEWVYAGRPGFYVGHLRSGDYAVFADESIVTLDSIV